MKVYKYYSVGLVFVITLMVSLANVTLAAPYDENLAETENILKASSIYPSTIINDFNSPEDVATWQPGENSQEVNYVTSILNGPSSVYEGTGALEQTPKNVKVYEWRTIYREFDTPLDLSNQSYLAMAANSWGWQPVDYLIKVTLHSSQDSYEGIAEIHPDQWNTFMLDLKDWDHKDDIHKIEISFMQNFDLEGVEPGGPGYDSWDGRFQIDYIVATSILDMTFSVDGDKEGFTSVDSNLDVYDGSLHMNITGDLPTLLSPVFKQDLSLKNMLSINLKNQTDANQFKISWITEEDPEWNDEKSKVFDVESTDRFRTYNFSFADKSLWQGTLKQFQIEPLIDEPTGKLEINQIEVDYKPEEVVDYYGDIQESALTDERNIRIQGTVNQSYLNDNDNAKLLLYELQPYESKLQDWASLTPVAEEEASSAFTFEIPLIAGEANRLYSKFVAVLQDELGGYCLVDDAKYITNPDLLAQNNYSFPEAESKKGIQVQMTDDAEELGISHAALNVAYDKMLYRSNNHPDNTIEYEFAGETFYFKKNYVQGLDNQIKSLSTNDMIVSLILIMYNTDMNEDTPNEFLIHPDAEPGGTVYAVNTTDDVGVKYYSAITNFLAERYTREDEKYGRAVNYIVGNEVGQNKVWNNMGPKLVWDYVDEYARTLRLTNTIVKSNYANARTYISLDHFWDENIPSDSMWKYDNKKIVNLLNEGIKSQGDIPWHIAFHPYPQNLFEPRFWNDDKATDDFNTDVITFKNLQVLPEYMNQSEFLYNDSPRRIILSEQGFHSGDNSEKAQKVQAAAYAYAYYKVKFLDEIDSFILHRHTDHALEGGLNLGLWTTAQGEVSTPDEQKFIYDVFKYIDTERSLEITDFAKSIIGIESWQDVIPNFDPNELSDRSLSTLVGTEIVKKPLHQQIVNDFNQDVGNWEAADNSKTVDIEKEDSYHGDGSLNVTFNSLAKLWRGATVKFDQPINASDKPYLNLKLKVPNMEKASSYDAKIKVYSGIEVAEGIMAIENDSDWNNIAVDLSKWDGIDSVDRIKVWVRSSTLNNWNGTVLIDEVAFAKNVVPKGGNVNLDINVEGVPSPIQIGDQIQVEVANYDSIKLTGDIEIEPSDFITFDTSSIKVNGILPGQSKVFTLTVTGVDLPEKEDMEVVFNYRELKKKVVLYTYKDAGENNLPDGKHLLYNFEGTVDGWSPGEHVTKINSTENIANAPQKAYLGSAVMEATTDSVTATNWRTVTVEPEHALDISAAKDFFYHINAYGGLPDGSYETKVTLYSGDQSVTKTNPIQSDNWNEIRMDIADWEYKQEVTKIEISFRGVGNDIDWNPRFQLDFVGYLE